MKYNQLHLNEDNLKNIFVPQNNFVSQTDVPSTLLYGNKDFIPNPFISIVVTAYNRPNYLRECLESAINQDCEMSYEIIVVDNNEEDVSPNQKIVEQIDSPKILYYKHKKNMGFQCSVNRGIELARGDFICFCHDDDCLLNDCLSTLSKIQKRTGDRGIIGRSKSSNFMIEKDRYKVFSTANCFIEGGYPSGSLFKRSCLLQLGGFNKNYHPSSDYALMIQYCVKWGLVKCYRPNYFYRVSEENVSNTVYKKFIERDFFYRDCLKEKIPLPNFYLDMVNKALYNKNKIFNSVKWGGEDKSLLKKIRFVDKLLVKSYEVILKFFSKEYDI